MRACVHVGGTETGAREVGGHLALQLAGPELGTTGPSSDPDSTAAAGHSRAEQRCGPRAAGRASQLPHFPTASL